MLRWKSNFEYCYHLVLERICPATTPHSLSAGCTISTIDEGVGSAPVGTLCMFPFTYEGTEYNDCTTANHNGVRWCYTALTKPNGAYRWGNCGGRTSATYHLLIHAFTGTLIVVVRGVLATPASVGGGC